MPTLPTFTVTQAQADRLLAAFGSALKYREWLKQQIVQYVLEKEMEAEARAFDAQWESRRSDISSTMTA